MRFRVSQVDPYLLLLLVVTAIALAPLLAPSYFYSAHDGRHSVFYVTMFDEAIQSGALWPRWAMHHNQGYGYPTFVVQAPLAFYVSEFFIQLGAGITRAVKFTWAVSFFAGAWGMYMLVRHWLLRSSGGVANGVLYTTSSWQQATASLCALVAGLLYTYAPYHLLDIYVRAALAETLLLAWFPWVFLAFDRLLLDSSAIAWQRQMFFASLSYAGALLTHSFALIALTPILCLWVVFLLWRSWQRDRQLLAGGNSESANSAAMRLVQRTAIAAGTGLAGCLVAAIFLFPLLAEGPLLVQDDFTRNTYEYTRHWVHWGQYLSPIWAYGFSDDPVGANDGIGFQLGVMLVICTLFAIYLLLVRRQPASGVEPPQPARGAETDETHWLMLFLIVAAFGVLAFMTPSAEPFWQAVTVLEVMQFPWRLLSLATFALSAVGGIVLWQLVRSRSFYGDGETDGVLLLAILVGFASLPFAQPQAQQPIEPWREDGRAVMQFEQEHPDMIGTTRFVEQRFVDSPLTTQYQVEPFSTDHLERFAILSGEAVIVDQAGRGHAYSAEVTATSPTTMQVRLYAFPGWQIKVDGIPVEIRVSSPYGLMEFNMPAGHHRIDVWMGTTPAARAGASTSIATLLVLIGFWLFSRLSVQRH